MDIDPYKIKVPNKQIIRVFNSAYQKVPQVKGFARCPDCQCLLTTPSKEDHIFCPVCRKITLRRNIATHKYQ